MFAKLVCVGLPISDAVCSVYMHHQYSVQKYVFFVGIPTYTSSMYFSVCSVCTISSMYTVYVSMYTSIFLFTSVCFYVHRL